MDSHFPAILLGKPFYGKCLHYLITAHCSLREYPLCFFLVPQLRTWGRLNQWTRNFRFLGRCRSMFAIAQTQQNKVSSYAAVVSFMFVTWLIRGHLLQYTGFYVFVIMLWNETEQLHHCTFREILKRISCPSEDALCQCGFVSIYTPTMSSKAPLSRQ